ncbi:GNAT family N-acetyltransferase [Prosthecodimorpha staleyi]|uniref:GNAT family N-acetyltransferase n=1 Tax=Prosthecodimorpha staleyi TaxID=2840188 RepID=A0A947DBV6_9HYPH|nr:GNAT family N-acetyltransferase [Prosthecodimorpha staleyi]MBT9292977.1 GNAT family N-acetyltransferase [Prosthecodimorpha staleyi]
MADTPIAFQDFAEPHLDGAHRLSVEARWPHRREDWALVMDLSQGVAALDGERVVGTAFVTPFGPVATVNMVIVAEAMRGRGLGRALMERVLTAAGPRATRLTATADGLPLYEKLGFRPVGMIHQHQGVPSEVPAMPDRVAWAETPDLDALAALDRAASGMERRPLLERLARLGRFAVLTADGSVVGFAALRAFGRGEVIGPVVAPDPQAAMALIDFVIADRPGAFLRVDTPDPAVLSAFLESRGLIKAGDGIPMVRGGTAPAEAGPEGDAAPAGPIAKTYALASQALG